MCSGNENQTVGFRSGRAFASRYRIRTANTHDTGSWQPFLCSLSIIIHLLTLYVSVFTVVM